MKQYLSCEVVSHKQIAFEIFDLVFSCPTIAKDAKAGQFVQIFLGKADHLLARPISICEVDKEQGTIRVLYRTAGKGTHILSTVKVGEQLFLLGPLGNEFKLYPTNKRIAVVGGGIGAPPMLELVKMIQHYNKDVPAKITVFLGFRSETILVDDFKKLGVDVHIATDDGSVGHKGNVIELMEEVGEEYDVIYACGPPVMLKFLSAWAAKKDIRCFVSMEERMACGLGVCIGCAVKIKTIDGFVYKKVCKDGPIFDATEVVWG